MFAARNMLFARTSAPAYDADAQAWFDAVVAAGSSITDDNKAAVSAFVAGCKADGIWSAIKASCLLCAADSLAGALVPLVGAAPTNNGPFFSGDYSRTTGLKGDGSSKYLNSNRNNNADPQDSRHLYARVTEALTVSNGFYAGTTSTGGGTLVGRATTTATTRCASGATSPTHTHSTGGYGVSRAASANYTRILAGTTATVSVASASPVNQTIGVFGAGNGTSLADCRISFYSIGESLNLALLDARLTTLMAALT